MNLISFEVKPYWPEIRCFGPEIWKYGRFVNHPMIGPDEIIEILGQKFIVAGQKDINLIFVATKPYMDMPDIVLLEYFNTILPKTDDIFINFSQGLLLLTQIGRHPFWWPMELCECFTGQVATASPDYKIEVCSGDGRVWYNPVSDPPPTGKTVLCRGEAYDADYQDGYFLAEYHPDWGQQWVSGKQQEKVTVTEWSYI